MGKVISARWHRSAICASFLFVRRYFFSCHLRTVFTILLLSAIYKVEFVKSSKHGLNPIAQLILVT